MTLYTHAGNAAALLFTFFHTLTHKNVTAGQRRLPERLSPFLPLTFCWFTFTHIIFLPHSHTQKQTFYQPFLATSYKKTQFKKFVHHRQQDLHLKCFSLLAYVSVCIYHLSVSLSALRRWGYRHVLSRLNTFASQAKVTESRAVVLVAMQPLN